MLEKIRLLGSLRQGLLGLAIFFILILPFAEPVWHPKDNWDLVMGGIVPAVAPIIFVVIMFDCLMTVVMKSGADEVKLANLNFILRSNFIVAFNLLVLWILSFNKALFG